MARAAKPCKCWRALPVTGIAVARARTGSRIASCAASGSQTDEPAVLHPVSLPVLRRGTRQPGATPETGMPPERPLTQPDQNAIMGSAFRFRSGGYGQDAQGLVPAKGPGRRFAAVQPESGQDQDIGRCAF